MKKVVILTAGIKAKRLYERIRTQYQVVFFADNDIHKWHQNHDGVEIISFYESAKRCKNKEFDCYLIPSEHPWTLRDDIVSELDLMDIDSDMIFSISDSTERKIELRPYGEIYSLPYIEVSVVEHCNLNCRSCAHFAPLAPKREYGIEQYEKDLRQLKSFIVHIDVIRLLGGEPLLCGNLAQYIRITRQIYPYAEIKIVTNGLLVCNMSETLINTIREYKVKLEISVYPEFYPRMEKTISFLNEKNVEVQIISYVVKFERMIDLNEREFPFMEGKDQIRCSCVNLYDGKMAPCPLVMFIHHFNHTFGTTLSQKGVIDLYDKELTAETLVKGINSSIPLCRNCRMYCQNMGIDGDKWETLNGKELKMEEWVIDN